MQSCQFVCYTAIALTMHAKLSIRLMSCHYMDWWWYVGGCLAWRFSTLSGSIPATSSLLFCFVLSCPCLHKSSFQILLLSSAELRKHILSEKLCGVVLGTMSVILIMHTLNITRWKFLVDDISLWGELLTSRKFLFRRWKLWR